MSSVVLRGNRVSEVRALNGIRGLAAIYVILLHYFSPIPLTTPFFCFFAHGYLAVDLFFPLSGFVMALNYSSSMTVRVRLKEYARFLTRRFARIYPLYLVTLLAASVLVARGLENRPFQLAYWSIFWSNLFLVQVWGHLASMNPPAWSISAEWFAYLFFPLLLPLISRSQRTLWAAFAGAALVLTGLTLHGVHAGMWPKLLDHTSGVSALLRCVAEFIMGIAVYRVGATRVGQAWLQRPRIVYPLILAIFVLLGLRGTDLAVALLFPWAILSLSGKATIVSRFLGSRPIDYLGQISFGLYLVHSLLGPVIDRLTFFLDRQGRTNAHLLAVAAVFPLLFACAAATHAMIEKPGRRLLRTLFEAKTSRPTPLAT